MSLPGNTLASVAAPAVFIPPDDDGRPARTIDFERGGIAIGDPSEGLEYQNWRLRVVGNEVRVAPDPYTAETTVLTVAGVNECALSFDQNMNMTIAYVVGTQAYLYWYDTTLEAMTTTPLASDVRSPFLCMDDKRSFATTSGSNDVLLFYLRASQLCYRQQRERYQTERVLKTFSGPRVTISKVGMNAGNRLQVEIVGADASS